jgi:hypothetical protein
VLNAKLFAGLAGTALVVATLGRVHALPHGNLGLHVGYFVFGPFYWQLFVALVCAVFGFAYFGVVRLTRRPLNQMVGLVSFFFVAFAFGSWLISSFLMTSDSLPSRRL